MLPIFCLRLACGLAGSLVLLWSLPISPRFYRVHFLIILGLTATAALLLRQMPGLWLWITVLGAVVMAVVGYGVWSLEGLRGKQVLAVVTALSLTASLGFVHSGYERPISPYAIVRVVENIAPDETSGAPGLLWLFSDDLASAAVLGVATTAMLMGHSYLIAPSMSLVPLLRLLAALFVVLIVRIGLAAFALCYWTTVRSLANLDDMTVLWLPLRWGVGFAAPLVLTWMARQAARIRSTQSATGILYVVVIFCFLGELTSQLLLGSTGLIL